MELIQLVGLIQQRQADDLLNEYQNSDEAMEDLSLPDYIPNSVRREGRRNRVSCFWGSHQWIKEGC